MRLGKKLSKKMIKSRDYIVMGFCTTLL